MDITWHVDQALRRCLATIYGQDTIHANLSALFRFICYARHSTELNMTNRQKFKLGPTYDVISDPDVNNIGVLREFPVTIGGVWFLQIGPVVSEMGGKKYLPAGRNSVVLYKYYSWA